MKSIAAKLALFLVFGLSSCATQTGGTSPRESDPNGLPRIRQVKPVEPAPQEVRTPAPDPREGVYYGKAAYYSDKLVGKMTASGERYDRNKLTAAHPFLPFNTECKVTNLANGYSIIVRINDRCSPSMGRILDLSYRAAEKLDIIQAGVVNVKLEIVGGGSLAN